jgi:hypothetical protein
MGASIFVSVTVPRMRCKENAFSFCLRRFFPSASGVSLVLLAFLPVPSRSVFFLTCSSLHYLLVVLADIMFVLVVAVLVSYACSLRNVGPLVFQDE